MIQQILVPDMGDFKNVEVIDVLVKVGDRVEVDTPLITVETEKASIDVPSTVAGVVHSLAVNKGTRVSRGTLVLSVEVAESVAAVARDNATQPAAATAPAPASAPVVTPMFAPEADSSSAVAPLEQYDFDVVVLGAGPGGYTAAFRAADLGMKVALIERWPTLGGVCLNVGCIPSKALLHAAKVIDEAREMAEHGITFGKPTIDIDKLRHWKNSVISKLTSGLTGLAKQRKVEVIHGTGQFASPHELDVKNGNEQRRVSFRNCIIAAGSEPVKLPGYPDDPRIIDSTGALELNLPKRMLVVGGGIIGLEMATVYEALGVKVSVVELMDGLVTGCDRDLVKPLEKRIARRYEKIMVKTKVTKVEALKEGIRVSFEGATDGAAAIEPQLYDKVLLAVGRAPNGRKVNAEAAGVVVNERGFIPVDKQQRTNVPHIFAIGDIVGQPMLAHKATHEGKLAAEVAFGEKRYFDARIIPAVAYTDPEIAWVGLTETEAKAKGIAYEKASFPWAASGRSLALGRDEGMTKLLFDTETHRVVGGGVVGTNAGELIAEIALAIEMGCDAADIGATIHAHPTLAETVTFSAEAFEGTLTDLYIPKKKH